MRRRNDSVSCDRCGKSIDSVESYFHCNNHNCNYDFCEDCGKSFEIAIVAPIDKNIRKELLRLAAVQPSLNLLENFVELPESSQLTILEMY
jgi:hypothetical protein